MSAEELELATEFPARTADDWRPVAEASLRGKPLGKLTRKTLDGIAVEPLYGPDATTPDAAGLPGQAPYTRGAAAAGAPEGWAVAAEHAHADLDRLQAELLTDLERGVGQVHLRFDRAARALEPDGLAIDGAPVRTTDDLLLALDGVHEHMAPVVLDAGASFAGAAASMAALWKARARAPEARNGGFGADPLGALAQTGRLAGSLETNLGTLADLATWTRAEAPRVQAIRARSGVYADAGATEAQELGCVLAAAVTYLRAQVEAGATPAEAASQISLELTVGARFFADIAKLRAVRRLWARVQEAFGVEAPQVHLHAVALGRMRTRRDPWVNMLRNTAACFAGAVGGADSIRVDAFDVAHGLPERLGRRVARNTQIILQEESHLGAVTDPAGGAWFVEHLTEQLGRTAWSELQAIEAEGGLAAALSSGWLQARLSKTHGERAARIAKRKQPITGVSEFANLTEASVSTQAVDLDAVRAASAARLADKARPAVEAERFADAVQAAVDGATIADITAALASGEATTVTPLPVHRDAEAFEALRDATDAPAARPKVLMVPLGSVAQHTARATWAQNFFGAAGFETVRVEDLGDAEAVRAALAELSTTVAVICGPDDLYAEQVATLAPQLRAGGVETLFLAGAPGDKREAYERAGVTGFVHIGCDVLGILQDVAKRMGVMS